MPTQFEGLVPNYGLDNAATPRWLMDKRVFLTDAKGLVVTSVSPVDIVGAAVCLWNDVLHLDRRLTQPAGSGATALKYLGAYVARTVISDGRIFAVDQRGVTFRWKDRSGPQSQQVMTLTGSEFVRRYLRHVLPLGLRSIRYYGFCHPAAKAKRQRIQIHTGMPFDLNSRPSPDAAPPGVAPWPRCPTCDNPMRLTGSILPPYRTLARQRGPPAAKRRRNQAISSFLP